MGSRTQIAEHRDRWSVQLPIPLRVKLTDVADYMKADLGRSPSWPEVIEYLHRHWRETT